MIYALLNQTLYRVVKKTPKGLTLRELTEEGESTWNRRCTSFIELYHILFLTEEEMYAIKPILERARRRRASRRNHPVTEEEKLYVHTRGY
jgi:hypothetical protein